MPEPAETSLAIELARSLLTAVEAFID